MSENVDRIEEVTPEELLKRGMSHSFTLNNLDDVHEFIDTKMNRNSR